MYYLIHDARITWGAFIPAEAPIAGKNERCIELPLALDVMQLNRPGRVLDAGCALNGALSTEMQATVYHATQNIASEKGYAHTTRPLSYLSADIRDLSLFVTCGFDRTVCVSTLEHVGMDNSGYMGQSEHAPETMLTAFKELCRVTREWLFITVPYGEPPVSCPQWRFIGDDTLAQMVKIAKNFGHIGELRYYAKTAGGWYGGGTKPVDASLDGYPGAVNAIACLRCHR